MIELSAELEGEVQISRRLGFVAKEIDDFSPALEASSNTLLKSFDNNFEARGKLYGGWAPRKVMVDWPLLEKTGDMRGSFDAAVTKSQAVLFNTAEQFPFHQSNKPRNRLPRRVMMMIDQQSRREIIKHFQEQVGHILQRRF